jgi:hypothetical protein
MLCARSSRWGTERRAPNRSGLTRYRNARYPTVPTRGRASPIAHGGLRRRLSPQSTPSPVERRSLGRLNPRRPGNWRYPLAVPAVADQAVGAWTAVRIIAVE